MPGLGEQGCVRVDPIDLASRPSSEFAQPVAPLQRQTCINATAGRGL